MKLKWMPLAAAALLMNGGAAAAGDAPAEPVKAEKRAEGAERVDGLEEVVARAKRRAPSDETTVSALRAAPKLAVDANVDIDIARPEIELTREPSAE